MLKAAQVEFGEHGLEGTTVRAIAQRAGVDPSLVIQHYGSKNDLFAIAAQLDRGSTDDDVVEHLFDVLDVRLNELPPETCALVRSMLTAPEATRAMKNFLDERVLNLARASDDGDAELRAALTVSSILGLTIARHFLKLDALTDISEPQIETVLRPWLTTALGDDTPCPPPLIQEDAQSQKPPRACGGAVNFPFHYNFGLALVTANLDQRAAERSYGVSEDQLTPAVSWSAFGLRKIWNEANGERTPWWAENSKEAYSSGWPTSRSR
ncbi:MAG: TetR/AcrR family transcriptional regulator [Pseudonocardiaceae bacterium]